ncbi:MAG: hypothetical protein OXC48_02355 [Endozoicomonadaceae bacterium]|nr:hypothetical protein [Endozoicomonadaceae bacterium]
MPTPGDKNGDGMPEKTRNIQTSNDVSNDNSTGRDNGADTHDQDEKGGALNTRSAEESQDPVKFESSSGLIDHPRNSDSDYSPEKIEPNYFEILNLHGSEFYIDLYTYKDADPHDLKQELDDRIAKLGDPVKFEDSSELTDSVHSGSRKYRKPAKELIFERGGSNRVYTLFGVYKERVINDIGSSDNL